VNNEYIATWKCYFQGDKNNDQEPDALDLFKKCHYRKKKNGYMPTV
jgi:hypothetical protein